HAVPLLSRRLYSPRRVQQSPDYRAIKDHEYTGRSRSKATTVQHLHSSKIQDEDRPSSKVLRRHKVVQCPRQKEPSHHRRKTPQGFHRPTNSGNHRTRARPHQEKGPHQENPSPDVRHSSTVWIICRLQILVPVTNTRRNIAQLNDPPEHPHQLEDRIWG